jgi:hypothetical protein
VFVFFFYWGLFVVCTALGRLQVREGEAGARTSPRRKGGGLQKGQMLFGCVVFLFFFISEQEMEEMEAERERKRKEREERRMQEEAEAEVAK